MKITLNEKQLDAAMDAEIDRLFAGDTPPSAETRAAFKTDNRDEFVNTISAYLAAG